MTVLYRITSIPSSNPSPIFQDNKDTLNMQCLASFMGAFAEIRPKVTFIADHVSDNMLKMLEDFPWEGSTVIKTDIGQNATMLMSYEIASKLEDYVLFQESDYWYRPNIGATYLQAMKELGIVSPYDHPNFYHNKELHKEECRIKLVDNHHFRTCERNTMTWGCHSNIIKENLDILNHHGYLDGQVWYDLLERGYPLWTPIMSFATHMVESCLAPGVSWEELWKTQT